MNDVSLLCVCVCVYVRMYVCMHVCIYIIHDIILQEVISLFGWEKNSTNISKY